MIESITIKWSGLRQSSSTDLHSSHSKTNKGVIQISSFNHHFFFYLSRYFPLALYMSGTYRVLPWRTNYLLTSMQSFSIHYITLMSSLQGCGTVKAGERVEERFSITKHRSSFTPTLRVMGGSSRAGWSLWSMLKSSHLQGPVQLPILLTICEVSDTSISCRVGKR